MERKIVFPKMFMIKQFFQREKVKDTVLEIKKQIKKVSPEKKIKKGDRTAIACGSRGISNYALIVKTTIEYLKEIGADVFIIPAMGSHGNADSQGQRKILADLGITEKSMNTPIYSDMDTVEIGYTPEMIPVFTDKNAFNADHIIPINRIKEHTEFYGEIESGLCKMLSIGLAKQKAEYYHNAMFNYGYSSVILNTARKILKTGKVPFGLAIIENGYSETMKLCFVDRQEFEDKEKELLKLAKSVSPKLPFNKADILIIDEIGKDISGTGFDTKVAGRISLPLLARDPKTPEIKRLILCDLTEKSLGNAIGLGAADFVTQKLVDKIDFPSLYVNSITGATPEYAKIPLTAANDKEALEFAIQCIGTVEAHKLKIIRIKNTMLLEHIYVSEAYEKELLDRKDIVRITQNKEIQFTEDNSFTVSA